MNPKLFNKQYTEEILLNSTAVSVTTQRASEPKIERVLRWFEKKGNNLVGEKIITNVSLEHLQKLFGIESENPMYDCYSVESCEQIDYLQNLLNFQLDTKSYEYFIECDMVQEVYSISTKYRICLLINLTGDIDKVRYLIVDEFSNNPQLAVGDSLSIKNWRVAHRTSQSIENLTFNFDVQVMSIKKTLFRHEELLTEILVESPDKEEVKKLVNALREGNPDLIKSSTDN